MSLFLVTALNEARLAAVRPGSLRVRDGRREHFRHSRVKQILGCTLWNRGGRENNYLLSDLHGNARHHNAKLHQTDAVHINNLHAWYKTAKKWKCIL